MLGYLKPYIIERGQALVRDEKLAKNQLELVKQLLELKREMDHLVNWSFGQDAEFQRCRDQSFVLFINEGEMVTKAMCAYTHEFFKAYAKDLSEHDTNLQTTKSSSCSSTP